MVSLNQWYGVLYKENMPPVNTGYYDVYQQFLNGTVAPNPYLEGCPAIIGACV